MGVIGMMGVVGMMGVMGVMGKLGGASRGFLFCYRPSSADNPTAAPPITAPATGGSLTGNWGPLTGHRTRRPPSIDHTQLFAAFFGEGGLLAFQLYGHRG